MQPSPDAAARPARPPYDENTGVQTADALLTAGAGLLAGGVNAVAGGGSLLLFPALVAAGYGTLAAQRDELRRALARVRRRRRRVPLTSSSASGSDSRR